MDNVLLNSELITMKFPVISVNFSFRTTRAHAIYFSLSITIFLWKTILFLHAYLLSYNPYNYFISYTDHVKTICINKIVNQITFNGVIITVFSCIEF